MTMGQSRTLCTESDVVIHYRLVLGRDPESATVVEQAKRQPLTRYVRAGFASAEFHESVVSRLANGRRVPHERLSPRPTAAQISWLAPHLELDPDTTANLESSRSWEDFFRLLFADADFRRLVPALRETGLLSTPPRRLLRPVSAATGESAEPEPASPPRPRHGGEVSRDIVIVTGMHRSGTSLCANLASLLGVDMSDDIEATADNPFGHWERPELVRFHDRILRTFGRGWRDRGHALALPHDWVSRPEVQAVKNDIEDWVDGGLSSPKGLLGFKDPRVARLVPLWDQICAELRLTPRYVFCVRHPAQVIRSLVKRDGIGADDAAYRWMVYNTDAVRALGERKLCIVPYDAWFVEKTLAMSRLASFLGLEESLDNAILKDLMIRSVDPELRHDKPPPEPDNVATSLYRHLVESAPLDGFSAAAREASSAFAAVDEFMQPLLDEAYAERRPGENQPDPAGGAPPYAANRVRLAARLAANVKLHAEALGSLLDQLEFDSQVSVGPQAQEDADSTRGAS
jgi:hypothetical protein